MSCSTPFRTPSSTSMPSLPPAQLASIPSLAWASSSSYWLVTTYGGLNIIMSVAFLRWSYLVELDKRVSWHPCSTKSIWFPHFYMTR